MPPGKEDGIIWSGYSYLMQKWILHGYAYILSFCTCMWFSSISQLSSSANKYTLNLLDATTSSVLLVDTITLPWSTHDISSVCKHFFRTAVVRRQRGKNIIHQKSKTRDLQRSYAGGGEDYSYEARWKSICPRPGTTEFLAVGLQMAYAGLEEEYTYWNIS